MRDVPVPLADFDYRLPEERIAQEPCFPRDASRLFVLDRRSGRRAHRIFRDLPDLLTPADLLVLNDTRVLPARVRGRKLTGGTLEFLFVRPLGDSWEALCNGARELRDGMEIHFGGEATGKVAGRKDEGVILKFPPGTDVEEMLNLRGEVPLPPYIRRVRGDPRGERDPEQYQTVYARARGAVAAPTAGLHFTAELFRRLEQRGIRWTSLTLHVGPGTFLPVRTPDARHHRLHSERFALPPETARRVAETKRGGGRVVAVGTTVARVLEHVARQGELKASEGECDLYVLPGHVFRCVDSLITNFHLPQSTLLLFTAAFAGREGILDAYREAMERGYRFTSYGDAMLLL
ncbi:MAG: tRNA preQ1(34) S-adenosylmethionine ribosyltransferase-isomerase QueA [Acidobacteria bacterium]|nr:MAG: tRNA preQ1(34) S-adenosylmethionine ribosyltransferase-isomerase QueA [Acidobacteriota bacterium]